MLARQTQMKKIRINPKSQLSSGDHNVLPKFLAFSPKFKKKSWSQKPNYFKKQSSSTWFLLLKTICHIPESSVVLFSPHQSRAGTQGIWSATTEYKLRQ